MTINVADRGFDRTGAVDNAGKLAALAQTIAGLSGKPMPRIVFPEGIYSFSSWPDLAYDNLEIVAEGEVRLMPSCSMIFDPSPRQPTASQPGIDNFRFDGFHIYPQSGLKSPLVFRGIHRSNLKVHVFGALGTAAIQMTFCIVTTLKPQVRGAGTGVLMDAWPGKPALQSTASVIESPCLESCGIGLDMQSAGSCAVYNGTIETCASAVHLGGACGNNMFYSVEMEGNGEDVRADSGSHSNGFLYCGNSSKLSNNFGLFSSNWAQH